MEMLDGQQWDDVNKEASGKDVFGGKGQRYGR